MTQEYPLSRDFKVVFDDLDVFTSGLDRPECVLATTGGNLLASHGKGGFPSFPRKVKLRITRSPMQMAVTTSLMASQ